MHKDHVTKGSGFVSIVGAGPGPVDLMTLRALDRLQHAEVVVHDRLITPEVLAMISSTAQRLYVGKALGNHSVPQEQIHVLLVQHAKLGKRVVRLKGGILMFLVAAAKKCRPYKPKALVLKWYPVSHRPVAARRRQAFR